MLSGADKFTESRHALVEWSPFYSDYFASSGCSDASSVELHRVKYKPSAPRRDGSIICSNQARRYFRVGAYADPSQQPITCLAWFPRATGASGASLTGASGGGASAGANADCELMLLATGSVSGRVNLLGFVPSHADEAYVGAAASVLELPLKYPRACNALAWNPAVPSQLASGLEKSRSDCSALIYDINYVRFAHWLDAGAADWPASGGGGGGAGSSGGGGGTGGISSIGGSQAGGGGGGGFGGIGGGGSGAGSSGSGSTVAIGGGSSGTGTGIPQFGSSTTSGGSAGGLLPSGSSSGSSGMRLGSAASAAAVAAAARQAGQPLQKLAHSEATAALCWMPGHAHVLATGTIKYARLWDLRGRGVVHASWAAHPRVTGVAASALSPHLLATYSDATQEPVKVWDVRKLGSTGNPMPVATVQATAATGSGSGGGHGGAGGGGGGHGGGYGGGSGGGGSASALWRVPRTVLQAVWSPVRAGVLATVLNDENVVHLWDLSSPGARTVQVPYSVQAAAGPIAHVSWQPVGARLARAAGAPQPSAAEVNAAAASPNRLLISTTLGQLQDTTLGDFAPLAVSATGEVVFARGSLVFEGGLYEPQQEHLPGGVGGAGLAGMNGTSTLTAAAEAAGDGAPSRRSSLMGETLALPSAAGSAAAVMAAAAAAAAATASSLQLLDMEEIMRKRTQAGYSMDIGENQQLLADELDAATVDDGVGGGSGNSGGGNSVADLTALWRLWDWVDRIEQLRGETEMAATGGSYASWQGSGFGSGGGGGSGASGLGSGVAGGIGASLGGGPAQLGAANLFGLGGGGGGGGHGGGSGGSFAMSGAIGAPSTGLGTAAYDELFPVNPADAGVEALLAFDSPTAGGTSGSGFEIFGCRTGPSIPGACGIWRLHPTFRCPVFSSRGRRLALRACGWRRPNDAGAGGGLIAWLPAAGGPSSAAAAAAGSAGAAYDPTAPSAEAPSSMMEECEMLGQYERSAALAVFHGDLRAAVAALQRGVEALHGESARTERMDNGGGGGGGDLGSVGGISGGGGLYEAEADDGRAAERQEMEHLLHLVAMCLAGYPSHGPLPAGTDASSAAGPTAPLGSAAANAAAALRAAAAATAASASETGLWRDMCESLLRRPAMQGAGPVAYLRASCAFLAAAPEAARAAAASLEAAAYSQSFSPLGSNGSSVGGVSVPAPGGRDSPIPPSGKKGKKGKPGGAAGTASSPATPQSAVGMPLDTPSPASPPAGADLLAEAAPFRTQGGHGSPSFYSRVLQDAAISLADRLALACLYLPRDQLAAFVDREAEGCVATGDLEGVLVTGLGAHGVMLLQAYVDRTGDVQTAALVTARLPPAWGAGGNDAGSGGSGGSGSGGGGENVSGGGESGNRSGGGSGTATRRDERPKERTCCEWLETYRELLNTWQLWHSRALLDVGRAELRAEQSRRAADRPGAAMAGGRLGSGGTGDVDAAGWSSSRSSRAAGGGGGGGGGVASAMGGSAAGGSAAGGTSADGRRSSWESPELPEDVDRTTLPHLYVRCNFCNHGLPLSALRRQGGMGSSWLSRQKPVLTGCPACRKPLPKCYICLLPMGCLNPYLEIRRQQHKMKQQKAQQQQSGALSVGGGSAGGLGPGGVATGGGEPADALAELASIQFAEWFTWCQRCKHGGHAHHLADWFETHDECGISGCDCRCYCNDRPIVGGAALT